MQLSFGPIGWLMISEIFPLRLRGRGLSIAVLVNFASNALVTFSFSPLTVIILPAFFFFNPSSNQLPYSYNIVVHIVLPLYSYNGWGNCSFNFSIDKKYTSHWGNKLCYKNIRGVWEYLVCLLIWKGQYNSISLCCSFLISK